MPAAWPIWASLPQELVQVAASLLGDDDRWVEVSAGRVQMQQSTLGGQQLLPGSAVRLPPPPPRQPWRAGAVRRINTHSHFQAPFLPVVSLPVG